MRDVQALNKSARIVPRLRSYLNGFGRLGLNFSPSFAISTGGQVGYSRRKNRHFASAKSQFYEF